MFRMNGWRTPPKPNAKENDMHCCYQGCNKAAEFEIIENRNDVSPADAYTTACEGHVGAMLSSVVTEKGVDHWHVSALIQDCP